jgi:hypothetical protein
VQAVLDEGVLALLIHLLAAGSEHPTLRRAACGVVANVLGGSRTQVHAVRRTIRYDTIR